MEAIIWQIKACTSRNHRSQGLRHLNGYCEGAIDPIFPFFKSMDRKTSTKSLIRSLARSDKYRVSQKKGNRFDQC